MKVKHTPVCGRQCDHIRKSDWQHQEQFLYLLQPAERGAQLRRDTGLDDETQDHTLTSLFVLILALLSILLCSFYFLSQASKCTHSFVKY